MIISPLTVLFLLKSQDTLISGHTLGKWISTAVDLASKVRPFFRQLVPLALDNGIFVAIVTFSPQVKLIQQVISHVFPGHYSNILIRGLDLSWDYQGLGSCEGKQKHMASAAEEFNNGNADNVNSITRATSLLLDDDMNNVYVALKSRVRAVLCNPDQPRTMIEDLLMME